MLHLLVKNISLLSKYNNFFRILIITCLLYIILCLYKNMIPSYMTSDNPMMIRHDLLMIESKKDLYSLYYRQATSPRNSSYPFISGDTYRAFADYVFDETRRDNLALVRYGDIIFVKADMMHRFFNGPYRSINNSFILITHNSDYSVPIDQKSRLEDKKILAWYASNPDIRNHSKLFPIPIGLANTRWQKGNLETFMYAFQKHRKPWANRTTLLYVNFNLNTNQRSRRDALTQATKLKHVQIVNKPVPFPTYLEQVGNAKFVLSPPGNGLDCHRTWEALLLGAAPIVLSSGLDPLFDRIPAVVINNWSILTERFLLSYRFSSYDNLVPAVLYARYWRETIMKHRDKNFRWF